MIINWKGSGLKTASVLGEVEIEGKKKVTITKTLVFQPGCNVVDDKEWEELKKNKMIQLEMQHGLFEEVGKKVIKKVTEEVEVEEDGKKKKEKVEKNIEVTESATLKDLDPEKALEVIKDTFNLETLNAWRKEEARDEIRAAISNQVEFIKRGGKEEEEE